MINAFENLAQPFGVQMAAQLAAAGHTDDAVFFADDEDGSVRIFTDAQGGAVAGAQVMTDGIRVAERQDTRGGSDSCIADDDCAVVQRCIGLKNIFEQTGGNLRVQGSTRFHEILQAGLLLKDDQRANPAAGEPQETLGDFVDVPLTFILFQHMVGARAAADLRQHFFNFRLEQNKEQHDAVIQDGAENPIDRGQAQELTDVTDHDHDRQTLESLNGLRSFCKLD